MIRTLVRYSLNQKLNKLLELRYSKDENYIQEIIELPFDIDINKVFHL